MKVSVNTIKQYIDFELPPTNELVARINERLGATEEVIDLGAKYKGIIISRVAHCRKHENSDHLNVCLIDDGGKAQNVERNEQGYVQVVCGAPNAREGIFVAWLPPGITVPESFDKEPFVLGSRELRGEMSNGMLASPRELALGDDHDGILEITNDDLPKDVHDLQPGIDFAEVFALNDTIIDIENKMFTHRPDLFGQIGVAREISGIFGKPFNKQYDELDWHWKFAQFESASGLELQVRNEAPDEVPRLMAVAMDNVVVTPSPLWLKCELVRLGGKPINNIVDITNYLMLHTAQPVHAYDYDKIHGHILGARLAHEGENITLLNNKTYSLSSDDIVIVDGEGPVGLAGVMGGGNSEVSSTTRRIILEVANFDMYTIRRTSMRHGIFTDAVTRFNKGQSPIQNDRILSRLMSQISLLAGGRQASDVFDEQSEKSKQQILNLAVHDTNQLVSPKFINERLGLSLSGDELEQILRNVNFACYVDPDTDHADQITFAAPFWRTDIEQPEDIVEEVGRLYGFDKLPLELPKRTITPTKKDALIELKKTIRSELSKAGANEVLTYSFVHSNMLEKAGQNKDLAYEITNALSPDLQYYRLSLTPSLLDKVHQNVKAGYDEFALFELGKTHFLDEMDADDASVPNEDSHIALVFTSANKQQHTGAPYYFARKYLEQIINLQDWALVPLNEFDVSGDEWGKQLVAPYDAARCAVLVKENQVWGVVGEFKPAVSRGFKLPKYTAGFEINLGILTEKTTDYVPLPRYPSVVQDITLKVPAKVNHQTVYNFVVASIGDHVDTKWSLEPLDIYQADNSDTKNITFRFTISHFDKTMNDNEVSKILDRVAASAHEISAERV